MKISFQNINCQKSSNYSKRVELSKLHNSDYCASTTYKIPFTSIQNIPANLYFVRMSQYKTNLLWNDKMSKTTEIISSMMQKNMDIKKIIHMAEYCINLINRHGKAKCMFGVRKNMDKGFIDILDKPDSRGYEYLQKYKQYLGTCPDSDSHMPKSNQLYRDAITCKIRANSRTVTIVTGANNPANIKTNLALVERAYKMLKEKRCPSKKEIVDTAATIQWLIAQETPYMRGSDSMANLLTRSLLHSYGIELSPLKKNVSCDFEAFYRDLDDYIKIYPTLFEKNLLDNNKVNL